MIRVKGRSEASFLRGVEALRTERLSPHKKPRRISWLMHAISEVGERLAVAYHILDDPEWPRKPLMKRKLRDLDERDPFMTLHTKRRGVVIQGGVLILRGDGIAEERFDLHSDLVVLA